MRLLPLALLLLTACPKPAPEAEKPAAEPVTLHLAFVNDFHGGIYEQPAKGVEGKVQGGLPWLVGAVDALRTEHPDLVLLDGGDMFQGSWPINQSHGMGSASAFGLMKLDAAAVGNHEFDYGGGASRRQYLEEAAAKATFEWVTANIQHAGATWSPPGIVPAVMLERNGVKIGVIGLTTQDTPSTTTKANVADLVFVDPVATVARLAPELRAQGARVIVVAGHLTGSCAEKPPAWATPPAPCLPDGEIGRLLTELPKGTIDVIAAGHAHTLMAHRWDDTFVFEDRAEGAMIGRLDLVVGPAGVDRDASVVHPPWSLVHGKADPGCEGGEYDLAPQDVGGRTVTPSTPALELVRALEAEAGSLCQEVGCATAPMARSREGESGVGDVVADAMLAAFPDADLAVQNSGGLRADLPGGKLRRQDLQAVMPFQNRLFEVEITGSKLLEMFRIGSSGSHGVLQVAGASYRFDPTKTGGTDLDGDGQTADWETDKLCWVKIGGKAVDPAKTYRLVTTDFLLGGGDDFGTAYTGVKTVSEGDLLRDVLFAQVGGRKECLPALPDAKSPRVERGPCPSTSLP